MKPPSTEKFDQISERSRARIYQLVSDHYKRHPGSPWSGKYLVELERSIKAFYKEMGEEYQEVFRDTLPAEMQDFYDRAVKEIKTAGTYKAILGKPDPKRVKYMLESSFEQVALKTDKMALDHIRSLRQISAEVFRDMSLTGSTRQQVSKALYDRAMTIPGFEFIDKSGQKWSAKSYFKMLARTELMNAGRASYDEKMAEEGFDVMKLSTSGNSCDKCARFEGKLFSLSGATPGLPTKADLEAAGVFHPNCTHSYSMVPNYTRRTEYDLNGNQDSHAPYMNVQQQDIPRFEKEWESIIRSNATASNKDAIDAYTASVGTAINQMLRGNGNDLQGWSKKLLHNWSEHCSELFDRVKTTEPIVLYRCVGNASFLPKIGDEFIDKGFVSCSIKPQMQFGNVLIEYRVPKGIRGGYIKSLSDQDYENEFLLDKNLKSVMLSKKRMEHLGELVDCYVVEVKK